MSGEHRYRSAPATDEYRENFDRIFRGKGVEDECAGLDLQEIAFYDKYGFKGDLSPRMTWEEFKRAYQQDPYAVRDLA